MRLVSVSFRHFEDTCLLEEIEACQSYFHSLLVYISDKLFCNIAMMMINWLICCNLLLCHICAEEIHKTPIKESEEDEFVTEEIVEGETGLHHDPSEVGEIVDRYKRASRKRELHTFMRGLDKNRNGMLEWNEHHIANYGVTENEVLDGGDVNELYLKEIAELKTMWRAADMNGDDVLTTEESIRFIQSRLYPDEL